MLHLTSMRSGPSSRAKKRPEPSTINPEEGLKCVRERGQLGGWQGGTEDSNVEAEDARGLHRGPDGPPVRQHLLTGGGYLGYFG